MTTTRASLAPSDRDGAAGPRTIERRTGLPGGRAVVGALLMTLAAIGVFLAYTDASGGAGQPVVVADRPLRVGDTLEVDDLRLATATLPSDADSTFSDIDGLVGRVVLGPIGEAEIVQRGSVTDDTGGSAHEIALTLPRDHIAVGRLKEGERVDVFSTSEARTTSVVRGAQVVQISDEGDGSLTSSRELTLVIAVSTGEDVAAVVHALRTGDVTVVRSTFADDSSADPLVYPDDAKSEADGEATTGEDEAGG